jgi:hypothetical protein
MQQDIFPEGDHIFAHSRPESLRDSEDFGSSLFKMGSRTIGKRNRSDIISCHHGFGDAIKSVFDIVLSIQ